MLQNRLQPRQVLPRLSSSFALLLSLGSLAGCSNDATDGPHNGGGSPSGGASAMGGAPIGGSGGSTGGGNNSTNGGSAGNVGNPANGGSAGNAGNPANGGSAGNVGNPANGGSAGNAGVSGSGAGTTSAGQGGASAGTGGAAGSANAACPFAATFCSGFEETTLPVGAVYKANAAPGDWSRDFEVDSTVFRGGRSSLRVKAGDEAGVSGAYKMLAVPVPGAAFWVRFYIRQADLDIGGVGHNVFTGASGSDEPNDGLMVEFAEDVGLAFNSKDVVRWPTGYGRTSTGDTNPYTLAMGIWHCIEISYDSQTRQQQLFVNGAQQIDATDFPAAASVTTAFTVFKFGFNQLHGPARTVWYDDVAVAATRINCL